MLWCADVLAMIINTLATLWDIFCTIKDYATNFSILYLIFYTLSFSLFIIFFIYIFKFISFLLCLSFKLEFFFFHPLLFPHHLSLSFFILLSFSFFYVCPYYFLSKNNDYFIKTSNAFSSFPMANLLSFLGRHTDRQVKW